MRMTLTSHVTSRRLIALWAALAAIMALAHLTSAQSFSPLDSSASLSGAPTGLGRYLDQPWWLTIHTITIGLVGNAIITWSWHFTAAFLHLGPQGDASQNKRLIAYNVSAAALVAAMAAGWGWLALGATAAIAACAAWHMSAIWAKVREHSSSPRIPLIRYYLAACACLLIAIACAYVPLLDMFFSYNTAAQTWIVVLQRWRDNATAAHAALNLFGFAGLTILGTLVTLGPTILRTRMHRSAIAAATRILPFLIGAVGVIAVGVFVSDRLTAIGIIAYMCFSTAIIIPLVWASVNKPPQSFASISLFAALLWIIIGMASLLMAALWAIGEPPLRAYISQPLTVFALGAIQLLLAAMSYLFPMLIGGGPALTRLSNEFIDRHGAVRILLYNIGAACALMLPAPVDKLGWLMAIASALWSFDTLAVGGIKQSRKARARGGNVANSRTRARATHAASASSPYAASSPSPSAATGADEALPAQPAHDLPRTISGPLLPEHSARLLPIAEIPKESHDS